MNIVFDNVKGMNIVFDEDNVKGMNIVFDKDNVKAVS